MSKTIWKYVLSPEQPNVPMPQGAVVLTAHEQGDEVCLWVEVNPISPLALRHFEVFGTGHDIPCDMEIDRKYIGTAFLYSGTLVFHVYERSN
jgi:hypothetical protein